MKNIERSKKVKEEKYTIELMPDITYIQKILQLIFDSNIEVIGKDGEKYKVSFIKKDC